MADQRRRGARGATPGDGRPAVTLKAPGDSGTTTVHTTTAFNNLVFGQGYAPESGTVEEAYSRLLDETTGDAPTPMVAPE